MLVDLSGAGEVGLDARHVFDHLRAGLGRDGIGVCRVAGVVDPLARVQLQLTEGNLELAAIVQDEVTIKRVEKPIDLSDIPADGRDLAVAIFVEELLQASWAEILLEAEQRAEEAEREAEPTPDVVRRSVERKRRPELRRLRLGLQGAATYHSAGTWLFGPVVRVGHAPTPWFEAAAYFSPRFAPVASLEAGEVRTESWLFGLGARLVAPPSDRLHAYGEAQVRAQSVQFEVDPAAGYAARGGGSWAVDLAAGPGVSWPFSEYVSLEAALLGVVVLRGVAGTEFGEPRLGVAGGGGEFVLGLEGRL